VRWWSRRGLKLEVLAEPDVYAHCHGSPNRGTTRVVIPPPPPSPEHGQVSGEQLRQALESRLDSRRRRASRTH
jgi:hypothetical protein